ncbi:MAG: riboflavin biosynthesis protein RibF [Blautia sp.]|nr:riboflavin biosynthesis protein RibF [Blautia sp.]
MEYIKVEDSFPRLSGTAVTIGKFDGLHRGHRRLVDKILEKKEQGLKSLLFAIDVSDRFILTRDERARFLEEKGLDYLVECPLSDWLRRTRAEAFIREILAGAFGAGYVAVGEDYRFGYERRGNGTMLEKAGHRYGFDVEIVPHEMDGRRKISSTYVREELLKGNMEKVAFLMGSAYYTDGEVVHGRGLGHKALLPTINVRPPREKLLPPDGVYVTCTRFPGGEWRGITNIGFKPTVGGETAPGIETFLFDCDSDLYGQPCTTEFLHFIRPEQRFSSLEALRTRQKADLAAAKAWVEDESH